MERVTVLTGTEPLFVLLDSDVDYDDADSMEVDNYDEAPTGPPVIPFIPVASFVPSLEDVTHPPPAPAPPPATPPVDEPASSATATTDGVPACGSGCLATGTLTGICMRGNAESVCIV